MSVEELNELLSKISLNTMTDKREFGMQHLSLIEPFNGSSNTLATFIGHIDYIVSTIISLAAEEKQLFYNAIQRKLTGPAADLVRRENPIDWRTLRTLLIEEFGEKKLVSTLILELNNIKFTNSVKIFCDSLNEQICRIKDCIKLNDDNETRKNIYRTEVDRYSLDVLKKGLPYHITALLNSNPVTDFKSALKLLRENDVYNFEFKQRKTKKGEFVRSDNYSQTPNRQYLPHFQGPSPTYYRQQNPNYSTANSNQFVPHNNTPFNGNNRTQSTGVWNNSNQSRIKRYGAPTPMEIENFHSIAFNHSPPS